MKKYSYAFIQNDNGNLIILGTDLNPKKAKQYAINKLKINIKLKLEVMNTSKKSISDCKHLIDLLVSAMKTPETLRLNSLSSFKNSIFGIVKISHEVEKYFYYYNGDTPSNIYIKKGTLKYETTNINQQLK